METVSVQKSSEEKSLPVSWFETIQKFSEEVRARAFDLFERSNREHGHDVEHWLEAERQFNFVPRSDLVDSSSGFELSMDVPGFEAKHIEVSALPNALLVKAEASRKQQGREGEVAYTEVQDKSFFRRIALPTPIEVGSVVAKLEKGVLKIAAKKSVAEKGPDRKLTAAAA